MLRPIARVYRAAFSGLSRDIWLLCAVLLINRAGTMVLPFFSLFLTQDRGVPLSRIILDENGWNTRQSAVNCGQIARENGFTNVLTVSQSFHCARIKLIFERAGTHCYTVPAGSSGGRTTKIWPRAAP